MARCHVADVGAVALNLVIQEFVESGGSIARHSHEFGCERGSAGLLWGPRAYASAEDARP